MLLRGKGYAFLLPGVLMAALLLSRSACAELQALPDAQLQQVMGAGIALGFEDFRWLTKPTSYYEQMGSSPVGDTTFQRADMRWYGLSITAVETDPNNNSGFHWDQSGNDFGSPCSGTGLACPLGGVIPQFAPYDNPYVLRAYAPVGYRYDGTLINDDPDNPQKTIYEYVAPTEQPYYNFAFWGEIEAGRTAPNQYLDGMDTQGNSHGEVGDFLKTQTLIQGNAAGSVFRMFQFTEPGNETFAIMYQSHLRGDFRFSAAQYDDGSGNSGSDRIGVPVRFDENEGLHFKNVDAYVPLGQLFYQAMTLGAVPEQDGNFYLEIPRLRDPSEPATNPLNDAMRHFYSYAVPENLANPGDPQGLGVAGHITARLALLENTPGADVQAYRNYVAAHYGLQAENIVLPASYAITHGYSRWGNWFPCRGIGCPQVDTSPNPQRNDYHNTRDGIFFRKCSGCEDFDAFAYMITAVDVRQGNSQYSCPGGANCGSYTPRGVDASSRNDNGRYYTASDSCYASSGTDFRCGYGGSFNVSAGSAYTYSSRQDPSELFDVASRAPGQGLPVIRTDAVNIGDSRIEGMQINYLKFTSYGAGAP